MSGPTCPCRCGRVTGRGNTLSRTGEQRWSSLAWWCVPALAQVVAQDRPLQGAPPLFFIPLCPPPQSPAPHGPHLPPLSTAGGQPEPPGTLVEGFFRVRLRANHKAAARPRPLPLLPPLEPFGRNWKLGRGGREQHRAAAPLATCPCPWLAGEAQQSEEASGQWKARPGSCSLWENLGMPR